MATATITKRKRRQKYEDGEGRPYSELSPEAKERAREWWRDCERNDFDTDLLTECFEEILREDYGIEVSYRTQKISGGKTIQVPEIYWQLSCYQGDDVEFKTDWDLDKLAEKNETISEQIRLLGLLEAAHGSGDSFDLHVNSDCHIEVGYGLYGELDGNQQAIVDEIISSIEAEIEQVYKQACRHLMKVGYADIEYRDSDECIDEYLSDSDHYSFDEEGEYVG